ncbi:MAG: carotenoid oxygenase family protein [Haloechinothrix sp.]
MHHRSCTSLPYRYSYLVAVDREKPSIVKVDNETGDRNAHPFADGDFLGEPIFVPRGPGSAEDDGWPLAVVYSSAEHRSALCVLDAARPGSRTGRRGQVPSELLQQLVQAATWRTSGSNVQGYHFVIVTDRDQMARLATLWRVVRDYYLEPIATVVPPGSTEKKHEKLRAALRYQRDDFHEIIVPCYDTGPYLANSPSSSAKPWRQRCGSGHAGRQPWPAGAAGSRRWARRPACTPVSRTCS